MIGRAYGERRLTHYPNLAGKVNQALAPALVTQSIAPKARNG